MVSAGFGSFRFLVITIYLADILITSLFVLQYHCVRSFLLDMGNTTSQEKKSEKVIKDASTVMYNLTFSHVISQYLYVVAKLDVASIIGKAGKPLTAEQIAKEHGGTINVDYLQRILRLEFNT